MSEWKVVKDYDCDSQANLVSPDNHLIAFAEKSFDSGGQKDLQSLADAMNRIEELEKQVLIMGERAVVDFDDPQVGACDKLVKNPEKYKDWIKVVGQALQKHDELKADAKIMASCLDSMAEGGFSYGIGVQAAIGRALGK